MNLELLEAGKKVRNEIMNVIGQLEALKDMEQVIDEINIAYVNNKIGGHMIVNSVISKERADKVQNEAIKAINDEIAEYEDKLKKLLGYKENTIEECTNLVEEPLSSKEKSKMSVEEIKTMLHAGKSLQAVADYYKVDKKAIYRFLEKNHTSIKAVRP